MPDKLPPPSPYTYYTEPLPPEVAKAAGDLITACKAWPIGPNPPSAAAEPVITAYGNACMMVIDPQSYDKQFDQAFLSGIALGIFIMCMVITAFRIYTKARRTWRGEPGGYSLGYKHPQTVPPMPNRQQRRAKVERKWRV